MPTSDAITPVTIANSNGLKTDPLCKPTSMSKYYVVHNVSSLSSEYPDACPALWRHIVTVFLSFSKTTKSTPLVSCCTLFPNQQISIL